MNNQCKSSNQGWTLKLWKYASTLYHTFNESYCMRDSVYCISIIRGIPQIKSLEQENSHGSKSGFIYLSTSTAGGRKTKTRTSLVRLHFLVKSCPCHCFLLRFYPAEPLVTQHPTSKSSISGSCRCNTRRISSSSSSSTSLTTSCRGPRHSRWPGLSSECAWPTRRRPRTSLSGEM